MAPALKPFQLLEINIISAQDLEPVSRKMKTYATAWVHPKRRLSSRVDTEGNTNPTWNDKFVFRVDDDFLRLDTSAVMIEIYAVQWFRDTLVGTVRVLVGNLIPPPPRCHQQRHHHLGMRFVALQVRRSSGRPQGILNIGVALLDSSMRSMPLYTQLSASAVGYRDLMGEEDPHNHHHQPNQNNPPTLKPILRRSRSERSERINFDSISAANSSMLTIPQKKDGKENSIITVTEFGDLSKGMMKKGKASSVISGAELKEKPKRKDKKGRPSSVISDSAVSNKTPLPKLNFKKEKSNPFAITNASIDDNKTDDKKFVGETKKVVDEKPISKGNNTVGLVPKEKIPRPVIGTPIPKLNGYEFGAPKASLTNGKFVFGGPPRANSLFSDLEVGPSPSEVAAAVAKYPLDDDKRSSVLDGWSLDESVEGLRSKLERWRMELPPLYDRGLSMSSYRSTGRQTRRHSDGGSGLFSCFGNIYGYECQCVCGKPPGRKTLGNRFHSPSIDSGGRSFL